MSVCFGGRTPSLKKVPGLPKEKEKRDNLKPSEPKHESQSGVDLLHLHPL